MSYYERKAQKEAEMMPYMYLLVAGMLAIIIGLILARCEREPVPTTYNHQRVTEQQIAAIAKEAKSRGWKYIRTEDGR